MPLSLHEVSLATLNRLPERVFEMSGVKQLRRLTLVVEPELDSGAAPEEDQGGGGEEKDLAKKSTKIAIVKGYSVHTAHLHQCQVRIL
jgi:hypothetical protein